MFYSSTVPVWVVRFIPLVIKPVKKRRGGHGNFILLRRPHVLELFIAWCTSVHLEPSLGLFAKGGQQIKKNACGYKSVGLG